MKRGIDVSTYQGEISWANVKADGIDFAMIKATQGRSEANTSLRNFTDSKFMANITGANRWGIRAGVYHYLTAQSVGEAMQEAEYFLSVIEPYKTIIRLWAAVDVESKYLPQNKTLLSQVVHTFCSRVQAAGYDPIIYTNPNFLTYRLGDVSAWPLWLALWRDKNNVPTVKEYPSLYMWQWGSETVSGISGKVDANYMIRDKAAAEPPKSETVETAKQDNTPSEWAMEAVKWAKDNKIIVGDSNGDLGLHGTVTVEQMCVFAKRIYDKAVDDAAGEIGKRLIAALKEG